MSKQNPHPSLSRKGAGEGQNPSDDELRAIVAGENIEPGGTNIPLMQAMAKELLATKRLARLMLLLLCAFYVAWLVLSLTGCAPLETVPSTRLDGRPCRTTKVRPDFYSAETWTDCLDKDGNAVAVATNHTDLGQWGFFMSALIAGAAVR